MKNTSTRRRPQGTFRPLLESLETRLTPTTYTVSSLADSGAGSLRAAITSVNGDGEFAGDVIDFSVAGMIQLTSGALPAIASQVKIDGTTAPGFAGAPVVEIDNHGFAGLILTSSGSILASLSIVNANGPGVTLKGFDTGLENGGLDNTLVGNYIGLALDGSIAANTGVGLLIEGSDYDTIGGTTAAARNVISGNGADGIELESVDATVLGNFIGTDLTGQVAAANQGNGISIDGTGNVIGGTDSSTGNIIAFNTQSGVVVPANQPNVILSNSIFDNGSNGIDVQNSATGWPTPQLSYAVESPGSATGSVQVQVGGVLNVQTADVGILVQVFATLGGVTAGQGQLFLGSVLVTSGANGFASFALRSASVPAGSGTTFTATATLSGTSVFSSPIGMSTPNQAYVANNYQLLLSRLPDPSSSVWVSDLDHGATPGSVVLAIEDSTEYLNDQVVAMYKLYLQRNPDTGGEQAWTNFLLAGGTLEEVAEGLTSSQEYYVLHGGINIGFITALLY